MPTPYEDEAKRAAERTGVVTVTVIAALVTVLLVFAVITTLNHHHPIGVAIWIGFAAAVAFWIRIAGMWSQNIRSRRTPPSGT